MLADGNRFLNAEIAMALAAAARCLASEELSQAISALKPLATSSCFVLTDFNQASAFDMT